MSSLLRPVECESGSQTCALQAEQRTGYLLFKRRVDLECFFGYSLILICISANY